jgi:hypothetical protein
MVELISLIVLLSISLTIVFYIVLVSWIKSLKINLKTNEKIIKKAFISYEGRTKISPFFKAKIFGKIYLTNKRVLLKYISFLENEIEIPLNKIKNISKFFMNIIRIDYLKNGKINSVYFSVRKSEEWIEEINRAIKIYS